MQKTKKPGQGKAAAGAAKPGAATPVAKIAQLKKKFPKRASRMPAKAAGAGY